MAISKTTPNRILGLDLPVYFILSLTFDWLFCVTRFQNFLLLSRRRLLLLHHISFNSWQAVLQLAECGQGG
jgi:hypothetical protein